MYHIGLSLMAPPNSYLLLCFAFILKGTINQMLKYIRGACMCQRKLIESLLRTVYQANDIETGQKGSSDKMKHSFICVCCNCLYVLS